MKNFNIRLLLLLLLAVSACTTYRVQKTDTVNIRLDSLVTAPVPRNIEGMIQPYRARVDEGMTEVLCLSEEAAYGAKPESPLTNLFADLTLEEANRLCAEKYPKLKIDVSMVNRGGLRTTLPKGEIRTRTMFEMMPFENEVVFVRLSGVTMLRFINYLASRGGEGVGGMRFGIKNDRAVNPEIGGKPLDTSRDYWLVTSDYIVNSGEGSEILSGNGERINTGIKVRDQFIEYFRRTGKEGKTIHAKKDGRIYHAE